MRVPMPRPCWSSATANATSAAAGIAKTLVARERDDPVLERADE